MTVILLFWNGISSNVQRLTAIITKSVNVQFCWLHNHISEPKITQDNMSEIDFYILHMRNILITGLSSPLTFDILLQAAGAVFVLIMWWLSESLTVVSHTPRKLLGFHWTTDRFWPDFADIKHDYTQEFYQSYSSCFAMSVPSQLTHWKYHSLRLNHQSMFWYIHFSVCLFSMINKGQVMKLQLSCYQLLLSFDSKAR